MFVDPFNKEDARRHQRFEPLVEIYQDKGSSECRFDPRFKSGTKTRDEFCSFEILDTDSLTSASGVVAGSEGGPDPAGRLQRARVRPQRLEGRASSGATAVGRHQPVQDGRGRLLRLAHRRHGVAPGDQGLAGASRPRRRLADGAPIDHPEQLGRPLGGVGGGELARLDLRGAEAQGDLRHQRHPDRSCGSSAAGTSATNLCQTNFVPTGYAMGVPMGGDLPARAGRKAPRFIVAAWKDDFIGTDLEQIQIVKGWVDRNGQKQEKVYRVAGDKRQSAEARGRDRHEDLRGQDRAGSSASARVGGPGLQPGRARVLLRARAREAGLPLQHPLVPRCGSGSTRWT